MAKGPKGMEGGMKGKEKGAEETANKDHEVDDCK